MYTGHQSNLSLIYLIKSSRTAFSKWRCPSYTITWMTMTSEQHIPLIRDTPRFLTNPGQLHGYPGSAPPSLEICTFVSHLDCIPTLPNRRGACLALLEAVARRWAMSRGSKHWVVGTCSSFSLRHSLDISRSYGVYGSRSKVSNKTLSVTEMLAAGTLITFFSFPAQSQLHTPPSRS